MGPGRALASGFRRRSASSRTVPRARSLSLRHRGIVSASPNSRPPSSCTTIPSFVRWLAIAPEITPRASAAPNTASLGQSRAFRKPRRGPQRRRLRLRPCRSHGVRGSGGDPEPALRGGRGDDLLDAWRARVRSRRRPESREIRRPHRHRADRRPARPTLRRGRGCERACRRRSPGTGSLGRRSDGSERQGAICP